MVIDPLMAFLSSKTDSHKDQDVRRALAPMAALAERTGAAVLIVRHLNKAAGGNTLYRGGGSIGTIGAARAGLVVAPDPDDPERRILAANKHNLSRAAPSLAFRVETAPNGAARVAWGGTSSLSGGDILREPADPEQRSAFSEAKDFLVKELADGRVDAELVKKDARAAGVSERTLKRAKRALGVRSEKEADGTWSWVPPDEGAEGCQEEEPGTLGTVGPLGKDANLRQTQSAYLTEGDQGGQEGQSASRDQALGCVHGYPGGKGCYVHDPDHPFRLKERGAV